MNIRSMSLSQVIGVMEQAVKENRGQRNLEISVCNGEVNDGLPEEPRPGPVKFIMVDEFISGENVATIVEVVIRIKPDGELSFSGNDDNVGICFRDEKGNPTSNPKDVAALRIADKFENLIGRQYFFEHGRQ